MTRTVERLGAPEFGPVVDALARRFTAGETPVAVVLRDAPVATRRAVADLFGFERLPSADTRIRVDQLLAALGVASLDDLRAIVESLRGPLPDRRAERDARRAAASDLWSWLAEQAAAVPLFPSAQVAAEWVAAQRAAGARGGIDRHRVRLEHALAVLRALPADGVPLPVLADMCTGDPHSLDRGRTTTAIVIDAIAVATTAARPADAETWRAAWESVGVVPDQLSSDVLALGLAGDNRTPLGQWLATAADESEAAALTLANLRRWPRPPLARDSFAVVVENPSLIAEAARRRWSGPPLICSSGRPTIAVVTLVRQLRADGSPVYQHADFDPVGIAITGWLAERAETTPWHMTTEAYIEARAASTSAARFRASVPPTPWDPQLQAVMLAERVAIYEESLTNLLDAIAGVETSG